MGQNASSTQNRDDMRLLSPCSREEADTRVILLTKDAADTGYKKILIRTVDSNIIVLCIGHIGSMELHELWVAYRVGKHFCYVPVHYIVSSHGAEVAIAMLVFHAFTGCDTTSVFAGRGK